MSAGGLWEAERTPASTPGTRATGNLFWLDNIFVNTLFLSAQAGDHLSAAVCARAGSLGEARGARGAALQGQQKLAPHPRARQAPEHHPLQVHHHHSEDSRCSLRPNSCSFCMYACTWLLAARIRRGQATCRVNSKGVRSEEITLLSSLLSLISVMMIISAPRRCRGRPRASAGREAGVTAGDRVSTGACSG